MYFVGEFANLRKVTINFVLSVCPSVRRHWKTRLPLDIFSWKFKWKYIFENLSSKISLKSEKNNKYYTWRPVQIYGIARSEPGGTRWRTGGEVKGKLANGVGSQYSHATSERGVSTITQADAHTSASSSRLNWRPHRFKWTRPFRGKTKSGFCACAITFRTSYISLNSS